MRYGGLVFDESFASARKAGGEDVKFTRSERALLQYFTRHAGQILTRGQLLDAIDGEGSDSTDRSIDFMINRLRDKLGDSARRPNWIATQYGEGYVWIADGIRSEVPAGTLLLIGPTYGLGDEGLQRRFLTYLAAAFRPLAAPNQPVVLMPDWRPEDRPAGLQFALEMSFHRRDAECHAAALLRDGQSRQVVMAERLLCRDDGEALAEAGRLAQSLHSAIWRHLTRGADVAAVAPSDAPLHVRMHEAGRRFVIADQSWIVMEAQLRAVGAEMSNDPELALMWAMHLYARLLFEGGASGITPELREAMADEIERRVFASLAGLSGHPMLMLAAAKLIFFVGRGHDELAEALAEQAFSQSTAFAASFAILGQLTLFRGESGRAIELFDTSIEMSERGSDFHLYLLTFKLTAQLAGGDRAAMAATAAELYALNPRSLFDVGTFIAAPRDDGMDPTPRAAFDQFDLARVRGAVAYLFFVMGRHFRIEAQREHIMGGIVHHAMRRFGIDAVPEDVRRSVPRLVR